MTTEFRGDAADHGHIDWRHGVAQPAKEAPEVEPKAKAKKPKSKE